MTRHEARQKILRACKRAGGVRAVAAAAAINYSDLYKWFRGVKGLGVASLERLREALAQRSRVVSAAVWGDATTGGQ